MALRQSLRLNPQAQDCMMGEEGAVSSPEVDPTMEEEVDVSSPEVDCTMEKEVSVSSPEVDCTMEEERAVFSPQVGDLVFCEWNGYFYEAKVIGINEDNTYCIHFVGYKKSTQESKVPAARLRPYSPDATGPEYVRQKDARKLRCSNNKKSEAPSTSSGGSTSKRARIKQAARSGNLIDRTHPDHPSIALVQRFLKRNNTFSSYHCSEERIKITQQDVGKFVQWTVHYENMTQEVKYGRFIRLRTTEEGEVVCHVQHYIKSMDTVLAGIGDPTELFQLLDCENILAENVTLVNVVQHDPDWRTQYDVTDNNHLWYSTSYLVYYKKTGKFESFPFPIEGVCVSCKKEISDFQFNRCIPLEYDGTFDYHGLIYWRKMRLGIDKCVYYCNPKCIGTTAPYSVGCIQKIHENEEGKIRVQLNEFMRPEDTGLFTHEDVCSRPINELFTTSNEQWVPLEQIIGLCKVQDTKEKTDLIGRNQFFANKDISEISSSKRSASQSAQLSKKRKVAETEKPTPHSLPIYSTENTMEGKKKLKCFDVFSGAGGFSEGLKQSGVIEPCWAIEKDMPAAATYQTNHPGAVVIHGDVSEVLAFIVKKDGCTFVDYTNKEKKLPLQGEVDIICAGPPCQAFSSMNQKPDSSNSQQNANQVIEFLKIVAFYRPTHMLLENVRNITTYNSGEVVTTILGILHGLGYQTTMGLLQAGHYGVPQVRRRFFLHAAKVGHKLLSFPMPIYTSNFNYLGMKVGNHKLETFENMQQLSAPYRAITVFDGISDLPHDVDDNEQTIVKCLEPTTGYQLLMQQESRDVSHHVLSKVSKMDEERLEYLSNNNKESGKDLPKNLIPNYMSRPEGNSNYEKAFSRLKNNGQFDTITTQVKPYQIMGKLRHPIACYRLMTGRELARAQGFPDRYTFCGSNKDVHRQIGNAVPVLLAKELGYCLAKVLPKSTP